MTTKLTVLALLALAGSVLLAPALAPWLFLLLVLVRLAHTITKSSGTPDGWTRTK